MKKRTCFSVASALMILFACQPPVTFDNPQPADVSPLSGFPKRVQGKFLSSKDNSILEINENSMIRTYDYDQKIHISQLDSNQQLIGDTLFDMKTNQGSIVQFEGDSIVQHINGKDTLFVIDALNVLKKFKGYYFVNINTPPNTWQVIKIGLSRGTLMLSQINRKEDIEQLKTLTETSQDTTPYVFSPTRRQFKSFIRNEGFRDTESFSKLSN